jgi:hypothetical protein
MLGSNATCEKLTDRCASDLDNTVIRWEYATLIAAMAPIRGALELCVVQLNGHIWDYETEPVDPDSMLNQMGDQGWELISILALGEAEGAEGTVWKYTLKRPKPPQESGAAATTDHADRDATKHLGTR